MLGVEVGCVGVCQKVGCVRRVLGGYVSISLEYVRSVWVGYVRSVSTDVLW